MTANVLLSLQNVVKNYGPDKALDGVTLEAYAGEIVLLVGANGSGKSTLLRAACGLVRVNAGQVQMAKDVRLGHSGHRLFLYSRLSVLENLRLFAGLGCGAAHATAQLAAWDLSSIKDKSVNRISKGQAQRVALARAFLGAPQLLLLDEPSAALDEKAVEVLKREILASAGKGGAVLIATHDLARLEPIAGRVVVLESGKIACDSGPDRARLAQAVKLYRERNR